MVSHPFPLRVYAVLAPVSRCCPPLIGSFPGITHPSATRQPEKQAFLLLPFDLHVLSLPPAFNLSHDQTLQFKSLFLLLNNEFNCFVVHSAVPIIETSFFSLPIIPAECPHRLSKLFVKELSARAEQVSGIL